jgi:hypothetical protein
MITATSVADTTKIATATITINQPAGITVALNPTPPTSLLEGAATPLTAVVTNDSKNAGVNWTVSCNGGSACGTFSAASTASGTATTYTAPAAIPPQGTVTVTATSVTDNTKSATATIGIGAALADGNYVFHLAGQDESGPCFFAGAFKVSGGAITDGEQDFSDSAGAFSNQIMQTGSSLTLTADGNYEIVLNTGNTNLGPTNGSNNGSGAITIHGSKVSATRMLISEHDGFAVGSGAVDLQTSTTAPTGGYAFLISGVGFDTTVTPIGVVATAIGGVLNVSGGTVSTANSVYDFNFGGTLSLKQAFTSGSVGTPDGFGRVTFTLSPTSTPFLANFLLTGYVNGNQIQLIESQQDTLGYNLAGVAFSQGSNTGKFNAGSVSGKTYTYTTAGVDSSGLLTIGGGFSLNSNGSVSGPFALNDASQYGQVNLSGGSYAVDATGRATLSNVTIPSSPFSAPFGFQMYLDGNGNALVMGADTIQVSSGQAYLQTSTAADFEGSYALAGLGFLSDTAQSPWSAAGPVTVSSDNLTGFTDYNDSGNPTPNVSLTGTETSSQGSLSIAGLNALSFSEMDNYAYFTIDGKRFIGISLDPNGLLAQIVFEGTSQ